MRPDTEALLKKFNVRTFGRVGILEILEEKLTSGETLIYITPTIAKITTTSTRETETLPGALALTSERIVFTYKSLMDHKTITVGLDQVQSVSSRGDGIHGGLVEVLTMVNTIEFLVLYKKKVIQEIQRVFEAAIAAANDPKETPAPAQQDLLAQIQELADLHAAGVLTEAEFSQKKAELLARL